MFSENSENSDPTGRKQNSENSENSNPTSEFSKVWIFWAKLVLNTLAKYRELSFAKLSARERGLDTKSAERSAHEVFASHPLGVKISHETSRSQKIQKIQK